MSDKKVTNEELATMVANGFDSLSQEMKDGFEVVDGRLNNLEHDVSEVKSRLQNVESDVSYIRRRFVGREEFEDLMARMKYVEIKLGIESGK